MQTRGDEIRKLDHNGNWWQDTEERSWSAKRPFSPGVIDSTHYFSVSYSIDGHVVRSWSVNTRSGQVAGPGESLELRAGPNNSIKPNTLRVSAYLQVLDANGILPRWATQRKARRMVPSRCRIYPALLGLHISVPLRTLSFALSRRGLLRIRSSFSWDRRAFCTFRSCRILHIRPSTKARYLAVVVGRPASCLGPSSVLLVAVAGWCLTNRSSRTCFAPPATRQVKLATWPAPLRTSA